MDIAVKILLQQQHHTIHVLNRLVSMVVLAFQRVIHLSVNVHPHIMDIVVKILLQQRHHTIHALNQLVKMVLDVFQQATLIFANVPTVTMVLDVKIVIIALQIHVLIMVYVHKQQLATFVRVHFHIQDPIVNKSSVQHHQQQLVLLHVHHVVVIVHVLFFHVQPLS